MKYRKRYEIILTYYEIAHLISNEIKFALCAVAHFTFAKKYFTAELFHLPERQSSLKPDLSETSRVFWCG